MLSQCVACCTELVRRYRVRITKQALAVYTCTGQSARHCVSSYSNSYSISNIGTATTATSTGKPAQKQPARRQAARHEPKATEPTTKRIQRGILSFGIFPFCPLARPLAIPIEYYFVFTIALSSAPCSRIALHTNELQFLRRCLRVLVTARPGSARRAGKHFSVRTCNAHTYTLDCFAQHLHVLCHWAMHTNARANALYANLVLAKYNSKRNYSGVGVCVCVHVVCHFMNKYSNKNSINSHKSFSSTKIYEHKCSESCTVAS